MKFSIAGKTLLKDFEKRELQAYPDQNVPPVWTIGYGHIEYVKQGMVWTEDQCERVLDTDIAIREAKVATLLIRCQTKLTDNQFSALVCLAFNIGIPGLIGSSALKDTINSRLDCVPNDIRLWNKVTVQGVHVISSGLVRRREAEVTLWNTP